MKEVIVIDNLALVQLPEGAKDIRFSDDGYYNLIDFFVGDKSLQTGLGKGKYKTVGFWKELSEEQAREIFNDFPSDKSTTQYSRLDLLKLKIEESGWFLDNPYGVKEPETIDFEYEYEEGYQPEDDFQYDERMYNDAVKKWQSAELKTLHNPFLLKIEKI